MLLWAIQDIFNLELGVDVDTEPPDAHLGPCGELATGPGGVPCPRLYAAGTGSSTFPATPPGKYGSRTNLGVSKGLLNDTRNGSFIYSISHSSMLMSGFLISSDVVMAYRWHCITQNSFSRRYAHLALLIHIWHGWMDILPEENWKRLCAALCYVLSSVSGCFCATVGRSSLPADGMDWHLFAVFLLFICPPLPPLTIK